jgi:hypothetical protein
MSVALQFRRPASAEAERWARGIRILVRQLLCAQLDAPAWQQAVAAFSRTIAVADLLAWLDLSRLAARSRSFGPGEHRIAIGLPGLPVDVPPAAELALLSPGRTVPPHGRNNLATAHLVLCGAGRVRIYDRVADEPGAALLRPIGDEWLEPGCCFTGSDAGGNVHWLSAGSAALVTLDLTVAVAGASGFRHPSCRDGRVYLDPTGPVAASGLIRAPLLDPRVAAARFGAAS